MIRMSLEKLAFEYMESSKKCRGRAAELRKLIEDENVCETDRLLLRRRCTILEGMARETAAISKYLANYYGGDAV